MFTTALAQLTKLLVPEKGTAERIEKQYDLRTHIPLLSSYSEPIDVRRLNCKTPADAQRFDAVANYLFDKRERTFNHRVSKHHIDSSTGQQIAHTTVTSEVITSETHPIHRKSYSCKLGNSDVRLIHDAIIATSDAGQEVIVSMYKGFRDGVPLCATEAKQLCLMASDLAGKKSPASGIEDKREYLRKMVELSLKQIQLHAK